MSTPSTPPPADADAPTPSGTSTSSRPHAAARLEDRFNGLLSRVLGRRGWVPRVEAYTSYGAPGWTRILARALLAAPGTHADEAAERGPEAAGRAVRGWRSFFTAQVPGVSITVELGDRTFQVTSDRGGYVDEVVESDLAPGWHTAMLTLGGERVSTPVLILDPAQRTAMVSDIDDTIMVTALPRPMLAAWNSLVLHQNARRVVPGMAGLYRRWQDAHPGAPTFYLSTGAWNVAPMVRRFIARHGYPVGPLLLTDWGPTNTGWFRSGQQHKLDTLRRLIREFPDVRFVLVGDDGQHDPQIYGEIAAEQPEHVEMIAIRQLTPTEAMLAHGTPGANEEKTTAGAPRTVYGPDGNVLALRLIDAGLL